MHQRRRVKALAPDKRLATKTATAPSKAGMMQWNYDRAEIFADGVIHSIGIAIGLAASTLLMILSSSSTTINPAIIVLYVLCLLTMLVFSAAYNLWPVSPSKWLLRRFDQSAIYLLIAASYTPFIAHLGYSLLATTFLIGIWSSAIVGIVARLFFPGRFDTVSVMLYVAMGWSGVIAYNNAIASLSVSILWLVAVGGILYMIGIIFHFWERLRFQNAIWHGFVLLGASCHFTAVLDLVSA